MIKITKENVFIGAPVAFDEGRPMSDGSIWRGHITEITPTGYHILWDPKLGLSTHSYYCFFDEKRADDRYFYLDVTDIDERHPSVPVEL